MSETSTATATATPASIGTKEDEKKEDASAAANATTTAVKKNYTNWPLRNIKEPHANDVLYGRGGGTNHHPGNKRYRKMVEDRKVDYVNCKRLDKPLVALEIIRVWRGQDPPGRFLKMDEQTGLWHDVGDKKAREKTSQALREKAPLIREELERERRTKVKGEHSSDSEIDEETDVPKSTRFADGTKEDGPAKPGLVVRDHSLGKYIGTGDEISIENFSWQDPVVSVGAIEPTTSHPSVGYNPTHPPPPPPPPPQFYGYPPVSSHGSYGPPMMPPPPGPYDSSVPSWAGRIESWSSVPGGPPPPPPPPNPYAHPYPVQSGSWDPREHSLSQNPLRHATVSQAAYPYAFDGRNVSGHWGPHYPAYPPPMAPMHGPPPHHYSNGVPPPAQAPPHPPVTHYPQPYEYRDRPRSPSPPPASRYEYSEPSIPVHPVAPPSPQSPRFSVDPKVASQWSGQAEEEIKKTLSSSSAEEQKDAFRATPTSPSSKNAAIYPKPDIVKRMTSNQNENAETKPDLLGHSVKRCNLNREGSLASARLKEKYLPQCFDAKKEMDTITTNLQQSSLKASLTWEGSSQVPPPKPTSIAVDERMTTLDMNALDLVVRPVSFTRASSRSTTIDALNIDFDDDPMMKRTDFASMSDFFEVEDIYATDKFIPKPPTLTAANRITTSDLLEIVQEPIVDDDDDVS